jgi:hypothetical protein
MLTRCSNWRFLFLVLLIGCGTAISAQQPQEQDRESLNYGFVSPNTRDDLTIKEAIKGMKSPEEWHLLKEAISLACVVRSRIRAVRALGSWSDGAEHSVMLRVNTDDETAVRYLLSRMGRDAQQKSVLYFHSQPAGAARIYTLRSRGHVQNLVAVANILERAGIPFRTLVPTRSATLVYVVDLKRELHEKVMTAAKRLRARVSSEVGNAGFVGDEALPQAKIAFEKEINNYEKNHPNLPSLCR